MTPFRFFFTSSTFPFPLYPEFHPAQTFHGQPLGTAGGSPEPPGSRVGAPVPGLQPSSSVPGLRGPGVTSQELRGTRRRSTCGSGPGRCPPAPSGRGRLTSGGRGKRLSLGVARPRHPRQPGRVYGGGQRPGLDRLRGRTGSESWAIPRDCAARSGGQVGARGGGTGPAPRPAQPAAVRGRRAVASARTADPGVGSRPRGEAPCRAHFPLWKRGALAAGICSVVSGSGDQS